MLPGSKRGESEAGAIVAASMLGHLYIHRWTIFVEGKAHELLQNKRIHRVDRECSLSRSDPHK